MFIFVFFDIFGLGRQIFASELFWTVLCGPGGSREALGVLLGRSWLAPARAIKQRKIRGLGALGPLLGTRFAVCRPPLII